MLQSRKWQRESYIPIRIRIIFLSEDARTGQVYNIGMVWQVDLAETLHPTLNPC